MPASCETGLLPYETYDPKATTKVYNTRKASEIMAFFLLTREHFFPRDMQPHIHTSGSIFLLVSVRGKIRAVMTQHFSLSTAPNGDSGTLLSSANSWGCPAWMGACRAICWLAWLWRWHRRRKAIRNGEEKGENVFGDLRANTTVFVRDQILVLYE